MGGGILLLLLSSLRPPPPHHHPDPPVVVGRVLAIVIQVQTAGGAYVRAWKVHEQSSQLTQARTRVPQPCSLAHPSSRVLSLFLFRTFFPFEWLFSLWLGAKQWSVCLRYTQHSRVFLSLPTEETNEKNISAGKINTFSTNKHIITVIFSVWQ